jgi:hypothetical protein
MPLTLVIYICKGNIRALEPPTVHKDPNKLYLQNVDGTFNDISDSSGVDDILSHRGAALLDYDYDGDLDIISSVIKMHWSEFGGLDQKLKLYRNENTSYNHWIGLRLIGMDKTNHDCMGCNAIVHYSDQKKIKEVDNGSGLGIQRSKILYFGLGNEKQVSKVVLHFSGKRIELSNLKGDKVYTNTETGKISTWYKGKK